MSKYIKRTIAAFLLACFFCTSAMAATITPSKAAITLPKGTETFSFDVILEADAAFAGAEFGLLPSQEDVKFVSITFSDQLKNESTVQTVKDGCLYFGFFSNTNQYEAGKYNVATVNYTYSGSAERTISLEESKIVTIDEDSKTTSGDTSSAPFTVTIKRSGSGGGSGGSGGSGGGSGNTQKDPDVDVPSTEEPASTPTFVDITNHWAKDSIEDAVAKQYFNGTSATTFSPEGVVTRGMAVTVLGRFAGANDGAATASVFNDVAQDAYYAPYVVWGINHGIVKGMSDTQFAPDQAITREQISAMIIRYLESANITLPAATEEIKTHSDYSKISDYAKENMTLCYDMGLINGHENGLLAPQGNLTRAEFAVIMLRLDDYIAGIK